MLRRGRQPRASAWAARLVVARVLEPALERRRLRAVAAKAFLGMWQASAFARTRALRCGSPKRYKQPARDMRATPGSAVALRPSDESS